MRTWGSSAKDASPRVQGSSVRHSLVHTFLIPALKCFLLLLLPRLLLLFLPCAVLCSLRSFNPIQFAVTLQSKSIAFIGDENAQYMYQSLRCQLKGPTVTQVRATAGKGLKRKAHQSALDSTNARASDTVVVTQVASHKSS